MKEKILPLLQELLALTDLSDQIVSLVASIQAELEAEPAIEESEVPAISAEDFAALQAENATLQATVLDVKKKYAERFMQGVTEPEKEEVKEPIVKTIDELVS
jgi:di/tripeptidase